MTAPATPTPLDVLDRAAQYYFKMDAEDALAITRALVEAALGESEAMFGDVSDELYEAVAAYRNWTPGRQPPPP